MLAQIKADLDEWLGGLSDSATDQWYKLAMLKNECQSVKMQAYMRDKEIVHLQMENEKEHIEADKIHGRLMERKKLDIEFLKEEGEVLRLKLALAKLQAGQSSGSLPSDSSVS